MTAPPRPRPAPTVRTVRSRFQLSTATPKTPSALCSPDRLAKGRPPVEGGGLSGGGLPNEGLPGGGWGGSEAFAGAANVGLKMPRRRANLPPMGTKDARAPIVARPARGNHTRQGAGSRSGLVFVVCPLTRVVGLRPGRPTMGTLKAHIYCADALSGADRGSFAFGGADRARQSRNLGDRRWVSFGGANPFQGRSMWSR
jgi:hypothetical protein